MRKKIMDKYAWAKLTIYRLVDRDNWILLKINKSTHK